MLRWSLISGLLLLTSVALAAEKRTWKDKTGKTIIAEFVAVAGENVRLKRTDGRLINVPLSGLSDEDQAWVRKQTDPPAADPPSNVPPPDKTADDPRMAAALKAAAEKLAALKAGKNVAPPPPPEPPPKAEPLSLEPAENTGAILEPRELHLRAPTARHIVFASQRGPFVSLDGKVFDLRDDRVIGTVPKADIIFLTEALSPDGALLARSNIRWGYVSVWDVASGKELYQVSLEGRKRDRDSSHPLRFAFTASRRLTWIGAANDEKTMISWDLTEAAPKKLYRITPSPFQSMADIRADGKYALLVAPDEMGVFDCATGAKVGVIPMSRETIDKFGALAFSPDGTEVATLSKTVTVYDLQGKVIFQAPAPNHYVLREDPHPFQYTPDGRGILVYSRSLIDRAAGKIVWEFDPLYKTHPAAYVVNNQQICTLKFEREAVLFTMPIPWAEIDTALKNGAGLPLTATTK